MALIQLLWSWLFSRRIEVDDVNLSWRDVYSDSKDLIRLGIALMWSALMVAIVAYLSRALILNDSGIEAVGIFSAAFAISGLLVNFILKAMSADYYPRLAERTDCADSMTRLVNEQIEMGVLLAMPAILVVLSIAPLAVGILYSAEFVEAAQLLRWFTLGCLIRIIQWPIGFITLALGKAGLFGSLQTVFNILHVGLLFGGLKVAGVLGVSIVYPILYVISSCIIYTVGRQMIGFRFSPSAFRLVVNALIASLLVFCLTHLLPSLHGLLVTLAMSLICSSYYLKELLARVGPGHKISKVVARVVPSRYQHIIWKVS